jgi:glycerate kinase
VRILIAPDSFKDSLTAVAAAAAMAEGARRVYPDAEVLELPLGDGGEGTAAALVAATGGRMERRTVRGPLGEPVEAAFGMLGDDEADGRLPTAVVEMAAASGLERVPPERRDPKLTTTYGTGELIDAALAAGAKRLIVAIGGSATNDAGAGAMAALGARFLDADGKPLPPGGAALARLDRIDLARFRRPAPGVQITIASDVTNPLCGPRGASAVYGPQKGATSDDVALLDAALARFAEVVRRDLGHDVKDVPGAGAAGGLGAALLAFLGAGMRRGIHLVLETIRFEERLRDADLVLSGEGKLDAQTASGKTLAGIGEACRRAGVPLIAFAGAVDADAADLERMGIDATCALPAGPISPAEAMAHAGPLLAAAVARALRLVALGARMGKAARRA